MKILILLFFTFHNLVSNASNNTYIIKLNPLDTIKLLYSSGPKFFHNTNKENYKAFFILYDTSDYNLYNRGKRFSFILAAIKEEIICKESVNTNDLINKYEFAKIVLNSNKNITIAVYFKENNSWKRYFVGLHKVMPSDCGDF